MPQPTDIPVGECTFCAGPITGVRRVGHWSENGGSSGYWFSGLCQTCDVDFGLTVRNGEIDPWRLDAPDSDELESVLLEQDLLDLSKKFLRYGALGPKWKAFLMRRRQGDEVWRFGSTDDVKGFAIVRQGQPVTRFNVPVRL